MPAHLPSLSKFHTIIFDFDGVFTDNCVYLDDSGSEWVRCSRADGLGINLLKYECKRLDLDVELLILSTEKNPVVSARADKMGIQCFQGVPDKKSFIDQFLMKRQITAKGGYDGVIFLCNDLNDIPLMSKCGLTVVPLDAHPFVKKIATVVLERTGGDGFVRFFIETILKVNERSLEEINEFVSNC